MRASYLLGNIAKDLGVFFRGFWYARLQVYETAGMALGNLACTTYNRAHEGKLVRLIWRAARTCQG